MNRRLAVSTYLSLIAFIVAHTTNAFVADALYAPIEILSAQSAFTEIPESQPEVESQQQSADTIMQSGLFLLPPTPSDQQAASQAPPPPPLDVAKKVALFGTVHGREGGLMAVLEDNATKQQNLYRVGGHVPNVGTLAVVEKHRVLFREGTREEWLELALLKQAQSGSALPIPPTTTQVPASPQRRILDRREINAVLADPTRLLTQAQAVPYLTDGKLDGFRLYSVMPRGFFDKIGLQTNDILQRINGVELRDPSMVLSLIQQLQNERTVRVDLVRSTQRQTLTYEIR